MVQSTWALGYIACSALVLRIQYKLWRIQVVHGVAWWQLLHQKPSVAHAPAEPTHVILMDAINFISRSQRNGVWGRRNKHTDKYTRYKGAWETLKFSVDSFWLFSVEWRAFLLAAAFLSSLMMREKEWDAIITAIILAADIKSRISGNQACACLTVHQLVKVKNH